MLDHACVCPPAAGMGDDHRAFIWTLCVDPVDYLVTIVIMEKEVNKQHIRIALGFKMVSQIRPIPKGLEFIVRPDFCAKAVEPGLPIIFSIIDEPDSAHGHLSNL